MCMKHVVPFRVGPRSLCHSGAVECLPSSSSVPLGRAGSPELGTSVSLTLPRALEQAAFAVRLP